MLHFSPSLSCSHWSRQGLGKAASSSAATEAASQGSRGHIDACGRTPGLAAAAGPNRLRQTAPKSAVSTRPGGQDRPQITLWDLTGKLSLCRAGSSRANQSIWAALGAAPRELPSGKFLKNVLPDSAPEDGPMDLLVFLPLVAGQEEAARPSECSVLAGAR